MTINISNKEKEFITSLKKGDAEAFDAIFKIYGGKLYHFALGYLKSKPEAEEVVQEVFYKVWKFRGRINEELSFKAYLFKIAFNHIQELFLKLAQEKRYLNQIINSSISSNEMDERINYQSILELVDELISKLPNRQREIIILRKKEGMPVKDIAEQLGISPKTIENHITEAMKNIKKGLSGEQLAELFFFYLFLKE